DSAYGAGGKSPRHAPLVRLRARADPRHELASSGGVPRRGRPEAARLHALAEPAPAARAERGGSRLAPPARAPQPDRGRLRRAERDPGPRDAQQLPPAAAPGAARGPAPDRPGLRRLGIHAPAARRAVLERRDPPDRARRLG